MPPRRPRRSPRTHSGGTPGSSALERLTRLPQCLARGREVRLDERRVEPLPAASSRPGSAFIRCSRWD
ncbi:hypothetical protein ACLESO_58090, partial [Pyxidicoccus sp. 3LG]